MASTLSPTTLTLIIAVGTAMGAIIMRNYRKTNRNHRVLTLLTGDPNEDELTGHLGKLDGRMEELEADVQRTARLNTALAYAVQRAIERLNQHDDVDIEFEVDFRDDFLRGGGDDSVFPDGGKPAARKDESLPEYHQRLHGCLCSRPNDTPDDT